MNIEDMFSKSSKLKSGARADPVSGVPRDSGETKSVEFASPSTGEASNSNTCTDFLKSDEEGAAGIGDENSTLNIPDRPHQPQSNDIVTQKLKTRTLHFQDSWFNKFAWLHYSVELQGVLCHVCASLSTKGQLNLSKCTEAAFTTAGFHNWKKAIKIF